MKRRVSLLLLFVLLFSISSNFIYAADNREKINNDVDANEMPNLIMQDTNIPTAYAGQEVEINFSIKNAGRIPARNVSITPIMPGESNPFSLNSANQIYNIDRINPSSSEEMNIRFKVSENVADGTYPVELKFKYQNAHNIIGEYSQTINIQVINFNKSPQLFISNVKTDPENLKAGESAKLTIDFDNKGNIRTEDISVSIDGFTNEAFFLENGANKEFVPFIDGGSSSKVNFNIKSNKKITTGGHELTVIFKYKSGTEIIEDSQKIFLNIGAKDGKNSNINITNLSFPTSSIRPGNNFVMNFNLKNTGLLEARNIIVKAESSDEAVVPTSQSIRKIDKLSSGEEIKLSFAFMPTEGSTTRNYPISIVIEYEDDLNEDSENKYVLTQYGGIYVYNPPKKEDKDDKDKPQSKPKLIIDKYSFEPSIVKAGENFTMNLSFYNTNSTKTVQNIKIFLTSDEKTEEGKSSGGNSVFTPVDTSNTFYIDSIAPKGRVDKTIKMFTVPDAKAKTYTIVANFEYEDAKATEYTATELIGVPVIQNAKLDIGEINLPQEIYQDQPESISVEFYNTGKVTLYNLMVRLEGNFKKEMASNYIGNFEMGNSEMFDTTISSSDIGELKGEMVFTYEDSSGESIEERIPFSTNVIEGFPEEEYPPEMPPEEKSNTKWIIIGIVGALLLAFIGFKIYKKRKANKEFDELLDWEDESNDSNNSSASNEIDDKGKDINE